MLVDLQRAMRQNLPSTVMVALSALLTLSFVPLAWSLPGNIHISDHHGLLQGKQLNSRDIMKVPLTVQNNGDKTVKVTVTGYSDEVNGNPIFLRQKIDSGEFDWLTVTELPAKKRSTPNATVTPVAGHVTIPADQMITAGPGYTIHISVDGHKKKQINVPGLCWSGRIFIAEEYDIPFKSKQQPEFSVAESHPEYEHRWGFLEFTNDGDFLNINLSFVDFVGLALGISIQDKSDVHTIKGPKTTAVQDICNELKDLRNTINQPEWRDLCLQDKDGTPLRVLSPFKYWSGNKGWMPNYFDSYADEVWQKFQTEELKVNTDTANLTCTTQDERLICDGIFQDGTKFKDIDSLVTRPTTPEIFGCAGPTFTDSPPVEVTGIQSILCAAFSRTTYLLPGGDTQPNPMIPVAKYYQPDVTNHYAKAVHRHLDGGIGYVFPFDDSNSDGEADQSGLTQVALGDLGKTLIQVGGWKD